MVGAARGERAPEERLTHRNGYRPRPWQTRAGELELAIPKLRRLLLSKLSRAQEVTYIPDGNRQFAGVCRRQASTGSSRRVASETHSHDRPWQEGWRRKLGSSHRYRRSERGLGGCHSRCPPALPSRAHSTSFGRWDPFFSGRWVRRLTLSTAQSHCRGCQSCGAVSVRRRRSY
jgi:hypothetical protein